jgi:anti-anti-sigma factor
VITAAELARVAVSWRGETTVAAIVGEMDASNAEDVQLTIEELFPRVDGELLIDLGELEFIDSAGIRALLRVHQGLAQNGKTVRLLCPDTSPIRKQLEIMSVPLVIPMEDAAGRPAHA